MFEDESSLEWCFSGERDGPSSVIGNSRENVVSDYLIESIHYICLQEGDVL